MLESKQLYLEKINTSKNGLDTLTKCLRKSWKLMGKEWTWLSRFVCVCVYSSFFELTNMFNDKIKHRHIFIASYNKY